MANADRNHKNEIRRREERFEIVSLVGTLGYDAGHDKVLQHLHIALADSKGTFFGGHCMSSLDGEDSSKSLLPVFTTAEVTLLIHHDIALSRGPEIDPKTGFKELSVKKAI